MTASTYIAHGMDVVIIDAAIGWMCVRLWFWGIVLMGWLQGNAYIMVMHSSTVMDVISMFRLVRVALRSVCASFTGQGHKVMVVIYVVGMIPRFAVWASPVRVSPIAHGNCMFMSRMLHVIFSTVLHIPAYVAILADFIPSCPCKIFLA